MFHCVCGECVTGWFYKGVVILSWLQKPLVFWTLYYWNVHSLGDVGNCFLEILTSALQSVVYFVSCSHDKFLSPLMVVMYPHRNWSVVVTISLSCLKIIQLGSWQFGVSMMIQRSDQQLLNFMRSSERYRNLLLVRKR